MLIGELFIEKFHVTQVDIDKALKFQERYGGLIGTILVNMGIISEEMLVKALSDQLNISIYEKNGKEIDFDIPGFHEMNRSFLIQRQWLPIGEADGAVLFVARNPLHYEVIQYLQNKGINWQVQIATEAMFRELEGEFNLSRDKMDVKTLDISGMLDSDELDKLKELAEEAPVVNLVNSLIARGVGRGASDLHFEPYKNMYRVRFRIDGILHDVDFLPLKMQLPIASRIKILSGMDIAERRRPQDGQFSTKVASRDIDIRVSALPLAEGESLVLRFLVKESVSYDLDHLGLEDDLISFLKADIAKTAGVILLTGPTGSGKTTTLYSCLNRINTEDRKIITIENPVEYQLDGINQINVQSDIGYDFPVALRSILRQDPDVIMIGEIRDTETARVAMQSSLTGHLVLSTVHTNDAPTAYTRLIDIGLQEYLINSSLISVIAQRLLRKVCSNCALPVDAEDDRIKVNGIVPFSKKHGIDAPDIRQAKGCAACNGTGYSGRVGIMEYLRCTEHIQNTPKTSDFPMKARKYMAANNIRNLKEDGLLKVVKGMTTLDEVFRVSG